MGYRDHYASTYYTAVSVYTADEANRLFDPDVPTRDGMYVMVLADEGNQERFVLEGTGEEIKKMLDAASAKLASVWPDVRRFT